MSDQIPTTTPKTEAGMRLLDRLHHDVPWFIGGDAEAEAHLVVAIEDEAAEEALRGPFLTQAIARAEAAEAEVERLRERAG